MTLSSLRGNLYRVVDEVLETSLPVEITRNGRKVRIVPDHPAGKLSRPKKHSALLCDPDDLLNLDWYSPWTRSIAYRSTISRHCSA